MTRIKMDYHEVKANFQHSRKSAFEGGVFTETYLYRPASFALTPLFLYLGLSANAVTVIRLFIGILGSVLFLFTAFAPLAFGFLLLAVILDYVDGNVARITRQTTFYGKFLDSFCDNFIFVIQVLFIAWGLSGELQNFYLPLALGAVAIHLFTVFIEVQFERLKREIVILDGLPASGAEAKKTGLVYQVFNFIKNLDFGVLFPVMLVFIILNGLHFYIGFVFVVKSLRFVAQLAKILIRGRKEINVPRASSR